MTSCSSIKPYCYLWRRETEGGLVEQVSPNPGPHPDWEIIALYREPQFFTDSPLAKPITLGGRCEKHLKVLPCLQCLSESSISGVIK